jgi:release factor glutamine methyltransferase
MRHEPEVDDVVDALRRGGCVAAEDEARELRDSARSLEELRALVALRVAGEPLAWITGRTVFCGLELCIDRGVYVPRWQSESLARAAAGALAPDGVAVDLCTGAGSVALVLGAACPVATVLGTEIDPTAVACARRNGVGVLEGDLFEPLPTGLRGRVDVLASVAPYVPRDELHLLPRDVVDHEPAIALDGGADGLDVVGRIVSQSVDWVRHGASVFLEAGTDQCDEVIAMLEAVGYLDAALIEDADGDPRGVGARWP